MTLNNVAWKVLFQLFLDPYPQANDVVTKDLGIFPTLDVFLQGNYAGFTGMPMRLVVWSYMVMHLKKYITEPTSCDRGSSSPSSSWWPLLTPFWQSPGRDSAEGGYGKCWTGITPYDPFMVLIKLPYWHSMVQYSIIRADWYSTHAFQLCIHQSSVTRLK